MLLPALLPILGWLAHILPCLSFPALKAGWRERFPPWQGPAGISKGCASPWWDGGCSGTKQGTGPILPSQPGSGVTGAVESGWRGTQQCPGSGVEVPASPGASCITTGHGSSHDPGKPRHGRGRGVGWGCRSSEQPPLPRPRAPEGWRKSRERAAACPPPPPPSPPRSLANKCLFLQKKEVTGVGAALST